MTPEQIEKARAHHREYLRQLAEYDRKFRQQEGPTDPK